MEFKIVWFMNTDTNTNFPVQARSDRLADFVSLDVPPEAPPQAGSGARMPGVSGVASLGLSTIFTNIPHKFPIKPILSKLRWFVPCECSISQVERRLELMAQKFPQIDIEGNDL